MAEEEKELEIEEGGGKSNKMMIIIIAAVVLIGGGVGAFMFLGGDDAPEEGAAEETLAEGEAKSNDGDAPSADIGDAIYVAMPRPFVFNVPGASRDRLVQIKVQMMMRGEENEEKIKSHIPLLEGTLLKTFSSTNADDLGTPEGKDALKAKALSDVQTTLIDVAGGKVIERVLFTGFVMQ
ncbi:flagellar basal body-associated protein FliL [Flocculibacter collagenilyticus]|uniref:flagellar basal body-associated protein FliL n=1 Tax=Flocculibacter collagenilyticus TaxID=2744479 RepID=UPI0018F293ED|nr:flagellar basal body-associated protein FliL [Flocculibacter collagenilyticus]